MLAKQPLGSLQCSWQGPQTVGMVQGGHYRVVGTTSAAAFAANATLASVRWVATVDALTASPPTSGPKVMVVLRIAVALTVVTTITAQRADPIVGVIQRSYSASENTLNTNLTLTTNNGKMNTNFPTSTLTQFAVASGAAGISGGTSTADANPFGMVDIGASGVTGLGVIEQDLYRHDAIHGEYPLVLNNNEGFKINWGPTALATGTATVSVAVDWMESYKF